MSGGGSDRRESQLEPLVGPKSRERFEADKLPHREFDWLTPIDNCLDNVRSEEGERQDAADLAIIDANLKGDSAEPIAQRLREMGIPYVVMSGYLKEQIGPWVADKKIIRKPFLIEELIEEIESASNPDQPVAG